MTTFIDADAFIGLYSKNDALHEKATRRLGTLLEENDQNMLYTSWDVVDEVATKLSYKVSKNHAQLFLSKLQELAIHVFFPTSTEAERAREFFCSIPSKNVSMTDCMNMILVKKNGINAIFSFDATYKQQGFKTVT